MSYRFAIVGCGRIGQRHAECIAGVGALVAVCDVVTDRAVTLATKYHASAYFSVEKMLEEAKPEVVVVCSPNGLHAEHCTLALESNCHVLCEKPMAIKVVDAIKMCSSAARFGKKLYVVKQNRFNPPVELLKQLLNERKLGTIHGFQVNCFWNRPSAYYTDAWHGTAKLDGGILFTQFSHFLDLVWWLFGDLEYSNGWRKNDLHRECIEFEDHGSAFLKMRAGFVGTLHYSINCFQKNMEGSIAVFGEKGTVKIGGEYLNELEYFEVSGEKTPTLGPGNKSNDYGIYQGSMSNHPKVYEQLIHALNGNASLLVPADEAIKTVEIIESIYANSPILSPQSNLR